MVVRILNKNLTIANNYNSAKSYEVDEGSVFTETYNETLDSATIIISNQTEKIEVEPYDIVSIIDEDGDIWKYMCVDTYTEIMECVNPKIYRYEISLFSETKQLEGVVLPNLKITKVWDQTRSISYYIKQYMDEYCPQVRTVSGSSYTFSPKWIYLDSTADELYNKLENKFNNVECPEMQWNTPTLREVLNDLMMVVDCIPVLKFGRLDFIDLTEINEDVSNDTHINYVTRTRSSEDYISELQVKLENVTNKTNNENVVTRSEYFSFRIPDENATMTTENVLLKTHYPIYNLKKLEIMFPCWLVRESALNPQDIPVTNRWIKQDLMDINGTNLVPEYQEWITKKIIYNDLPPRNISDWEDYQNWSLYYTRGTTEIKNFYNKTKYFWSTYYLLQQLASILGCMRSNITYDTNINSRAEVPGYLFKIEYETLEGCLFRATKNELPDNERTVIDNQTNSMVDSYTQGFLEYQKANRLGNEQLQINARYNLPLGDELIKISDIFDDSIIYQCQYQYFKDHVEVNAIATKNYVLREYFTGVKSKIRSWAIVSGSEALTRHDLLKYYCEFSYNPHIEQAGLTTLVENNIAEYFVSPLADYNVSPLKYCFVRTKLIDESYFPADYLNYPNYYSLDLINRIVGNSIVLTFGFLDNYWAGQALHTVCDFDGQTPPSDDKYIEDSGIDWSVLTGISIAPKIEGGYPMHQYSYTNTDGEFDSGEIVFSDDIKVIPSFKRTVDGVDIDIYYNDPGDDEPWCYNTGNGYAINSNSQYFLFFSLIKPRVFETNFKYEAVDSQKSYNYEKIRTLFDFKKDSQEITNISTQFEFSTDTTSICFTKEWIKRQQAISTNSNSHTYKAYFFSKSKYDFRRPDILPTGGTSLTATFTFPQTVNSSIGIKCEFNNLFYKEGSADIEKIIIRNNKCVYITDENDMVLFAFKDIPKNNFEVVKKTISDVHFYNIAVTLYLNILKTRNKNIYSTGNHYLISGKI